VISKLQVKLFALKTASNKLKYRFIVVFQFHSFLVLTEAELNQERQLTSNVFFSFLEQSRFSMNSKIKCKQNVCWAASMRGGYILDLIACILKTIYQRIKTKYSCL